MVHDPIVIDPADFDQKAAWSECSDGVAQFGGLSHDDGSPNWRAAFCADPGLVGCPNCGRSHWNWGAVQKCTGCGFVYPTDWWPMYSWGVQDGWGSEMFRKSRRRERRMKHRYYEHGRLNPPDRESTPDLYQHAHVIRWREVIGDWEIVGRGAKERG